jgi:CDP-glucose 4,6-dehydratase
MPSRDWSERIVLVTGASGFVGSWLVKALLEAGARIVALVNELDPGSELCRSRDLERVSVVYGTATDEAAIERALLAHEVDTVFHLGAQTQVGVGLSAPFLTLDANVRGTYTLLEVVRRHRVQVARVVVASSDKAYGPQSRLPYTEDAPLTGRSPYDASKSCMDLIAQSYHATYGLPILIARCANIYGGGDLNWNRLVPGTIRSFHAGARPVLRSDGRAVRDYLDVRDAVEAYLLLADAASEPDQWGEAYNFSSEQPVCALDVVETIGRLMQRADLEPEVLGVAVNEIERQEVSAAKARSRLGWRPQHGWEDGLVVTIAWYRAYFEDAR